jgi:hypothetical protein
MIKAAAYDSFPRPKKMSQQDRMEERLDPAIQTANISALPTEEEQARAVFSHDFWTNELKRREEEERTASRGRSRYGIRLPPRIKLVRRS